MEKLTKLTGPLKQYKSSDAKSKTNNRNKKISRPWCTGLREEDPFDKLIKNDFEDLRKKDLIKKSVRPEYNQDSSVENSIIDNDFDYFCGARASSTPNKSITIKQNSDMRKNLLKLNDLTESNGGSGLPQFSSLKVQNMSNLITTNSELGSKDGTSRISVVSNNSNKIIIPQNSVKIIEINQSNTINDDYCDDDYGKNNKIKQNLSSNIVFETTNSDSSNSLTKLLLLQYEIKRCYVKLSILPELQQSFINISSTVISPSSSSFSTPKSLYFNKIFKVLSKHDTKQRRSNMKHKHCRKKNNSCILINNDDEYDMEMKSLNLNFEKLSTSTTETTPTQESTNSITNFSSFNLKKSYVQLSTTDISNLTDQNQSFNNEKPEEVKEDDQKNDKQYFPLDFSNCFVKLYKSSTIDELMLTDDTNLNTTSQSISSNTTNILENNLNNSNLRQSELKIINNTRIYQIIPENQNQSENFSESEISLSIFEKNSNNQSKIDDFHIANCSVELPELKNLNNSSFLTKPDLLKQQTNDLSLKNDENHPILIKRSKRLIKTIDRNNEWSFETPVLNNINYKRPKVSKKSDTFSLQFANSNIDGSITDAAAFYDTNGDHKLILNDSFVKLSKLNLDSYNSLINNASQDMFSENDSSISIKPTENSLNYVNQQKRPIQLVFDNSKNISSSLILNNESKILFSPYPMTGACNADLTINDKTMLDIVNNSENNEINREYKSIKQQKRKKSKTISKRKPKKNLSLELNKNTNQSITNTNEKLNECYVLLTPIKQTSQTSISSNLPQLQMQSPETPNNSSQLTSPSSVINSNDLNISQTIKNNLLTINQQRSALSTNHQSNCKENNEIKSPSFHITKRKKSKITNKNYQSINLITPSPVNRQQQLQQQQIDQFSIDSVTPLGLRKTNVTLNDKEVQKEKDLDENTIDNNSSMLFRLPTIIPLKKIQPGKWRRSISQWKHESLINNKDKVNIPVTKITTNGKLISPTIEIDSSFMFSSPARCKKSFYNRQSIFIFESKIINADPSIIELDEEISRTKDDDAFVLEQTDVVSTNSKETSFSSESIKLRRTISFGSPKSVHPIVINDSTNLLLDARTAVLRRCGQAEPLLFNDIYSTSALKQCRKIGEGVYGEVFMNKCPTSGKAVVLKIIPIENDLEINGEQQKKFHEILSEIVIAMELSSLRNDRDEYMTQGFVEVVNVRCVKGRYPEHLLDLWELYRDNQGTYNDHPEIFTNEQLYIVLELANAGQDLEAFQFHNAQQSLSAFQQTALTLAVAEKKYQFEHRDLHWGNILIQATDETELTFKINGEIITVPTHGVKVTIIDYTLSHMIFENHKLFNDLSNDDELFSATGDYQYDIYRLMKDRLANDWKIYDPYTNILWLHYTVDKMINGARYKNTKTRKHRQAIQDMMRIRDDLLEFNSAYETILTI